MRSAAKSGSGGPYDRRFTDIEKGAGFQPLLFDQPVTGRTYRYRMCAGNDRRGNRIKRAPKADEEFRGSLMNNYKQRSEKAVKQFLHFNQIS